MSLQIFLSLSFVDSVFVSAVRSRLPSGVARYFERSFERGENLIDAMEQGLNESQVFVLFATNRALAAWPVQYEIEAARLLTAMGRMKRVLVFPIEPEIGFTDLPNWMQHCWIPNAGETPTDIARHLTTVMLEPDRGLSTAAPKVVGRGATLDRTERAVAIHLQRRRSMPNVYIFPGISGIGRRTFAAYYLRRALGAEASLPFGPVIQLSPQAELVDIYRALRVEIDPKISPADMAADQAAFLALPLSQQVAESIRASAHFGNLGQALTLVSSAGFFEDRATPKSWISSLLKAFPSGQILVLITNLQFRQEFIDDLGNAVQLRIEELADEDVRTLMTFTADALRIDEFKVPERLVAAIGGHPDVANAAVKLVAQKGNTILERDPRQLFNVQQSIIGEAVRREDLSPAEVQILDVLGWLPSLGSDLLEAIVVEALGNDPETYIGAIEGLVLGCLIYATGYRFSIASSVRQLYRRENITGSETLAAMSRVFKNAWQSAAESGFRDDLFQAFIFMQALEGRSLPPELRALLTPSDLYDSVRDVYARGKEADDPEIIRLAINWGSIAHEMPMTDAVREEILSTVARAQIRLRDWRSAESTITAMRTRQYRSVTFLEGHLLRKRRDFDAAIPKLRYVVDHNRHNRAAIHELALCYRRSRKWKQLENLLEEFPDASRESSLFLDFEIGLSIARRQLGGIPEAIDRLRSMGAASQISADLRYAQYLQRLGRHGDAKDFLSTILSSGSGGSRTRLRALRAFASARAGDTRLARQDLTFFRSIPEQDARVNSLEAQILLAEGRPKQALELIEKHPPQEPGDWLVRASMLDAVASHPDTTITEAQTMRKEAAEIRSKYPPEFEFMDDD